MDIIKLFIGIFKTAVEDDLKQKEVLSKSEIPETLDIDTSKPGELQSYPQHPQADKSKIVVDDTFLNELASWQQFFSLLLKTGGWTVAVLLAFRFVLIPLLTVGNTPVGLILAISVGIFLILSAVDALVKDLKK